MKTLRPAKKLAIWLVVFLPTDGLGQTLPRPLFDAFQKYCVNTGHSYDAIKAVAEATKGAAIRSPLEPDSPGSVMTTWTIPTQGAILTLTASHARTLPRHQEPAYFVDGCSLKVTADDKDSVKALAHWAGVAPDTDKPGFQFFSFLEQPGGRVAAPKQLPEILKAKSQGSWVQLAVFEKASETILLLMHQKEAR